MRRFVVPLFYFFVLFGGVILTTVSSNLESYDACVSRQSNQYKNVEYNWRIDEYAVDMQVLEDGALQVREQIDVNYDTYKHGIFRYIPLVFEPKGDGFKQAFSKLDITNISVMQDGRPATYSKEVRSSSQCVQSWLSKDFNQELFLKIGDADTTITGPHRYTISYTVSDALRAERGSTELYWNAIPQNWGVPIERAYVTLAGSDTGLVKLAGELYCYAGPTGSRNEESCVVESQGASMTVKAGPLQPYEGVTLLTRLTPSNMSRISGNIGGTPEALRGYIMSRWYGLIALLPFVYFALVWWSKGRDPASRGIVAPRYDAPTDISPARAGLIVDQSIESVDIASIVMSIAQKGHMRIIAEEGAFGLSKKYRFEKTKAGAHTKPLTSEEQLMYDGIFLHGESVWLSALKEKFAGTIEIIKNDLYNWANTSGYLKGRPSVFNSQFLMGYLLIALALGVGIVSKSSLVMGLAVVFAVASLPFVFLYKYYTSKGKELQEEMLGLKMYMGTAEKDRIEFHNAPEKTPTLFERLLPYAMALGVVGIWADKFKDLEMQPPDWYVGNYHTFSPRVFAQDLSNAGGRFNSVMTSVKVESSSGGGGGGGGGGSSGGGGGGGGGGSW